MIPLPSAGMRHSWFHQTNFVCSKSRLTNKKILPQPWAFTHTAYTRSHRRSASANKVFAICSAADFRPYHDISVCELWVLLFVLIRPECINFLKPWGRFRYSWAHAKEGGYHKYEPLPLAAWLMRTPDFDLPALWKHAHTVLNLKEQQTVEQNGKWSGAEAKWPMSIFWLFTVQKDRESLSQHSQQ